MIHAVGDARPRIDPTAFVHPRAVVLGDVEIGPHSSIWPGAVIRGDFSIVRIGARTNIQDNTVVHTNRDGTFIGDDCVVGHLAFIEEAVIEDACLVGVGSRILNRSQMRSGSVAAAGAVVVPGTEIPAGQRAQGVPARIGPHRGPYEAEIRDMAAHYVEMAARVAASLP